MEYLFLTEGEDGVSFFESRAFDLVPTDFAPPAPDVLLFDALAAEKMRVFNVAVGVGRRTTPLPTQPDRIVPRWKWPN